jgi:hypothetical protein
VHARFARYTLIRTIQMFRFSPYMTNFTKKVLKPGSDINPFLAMAEAGVSPSEIKDFVISELSPYFENIDVVEDLSVDILSPEVINLYNVRLQGDEHLLNYVLGIYRSAKSKNKDASFQICVESEQTINDGLSHYMSLFLMETHKSELGLHEYTQDMFKIIGSVIEACLKPFLFDLFRQQRICRNKNFNITEPPKLGVMVQELYDTIEKKELMAPNPWGIRLSQWRNIAQHHNTRIDKNSIICTYGEGLNRNEVILSREKLGDLTQKVMSIFRAIKLARTIFFIDNLKEIKPLINDLNIREETRLISFTCAVSTQGFKLNNLNLTDDSATAEIIDTQETSKQRFIHASQFLVLLWLDTKRKELVINYLSSCGQSIGKSSVTGSACESYTTEVIDIQQYVNLIDFNVKT